MNADFKIFGIKKEDWYVQDIYKNAVNKYPKAQPSIKTLQIESWYCLYYCQNYIILLFYMLPCARMSDWFEPPYDLAVRSS